MFYLLNLLSLFMIIMFGFVVFVYSDIDYHKQNETNTIITSLKEGNITYNRSLMFDATNMNFVDDIDYICEVLNTTKHVDNEDTYNHIKDIEEKKISDYYEIDYSSFLGSGCDGSVYLCRDVSTDELYACKEYDLIDTKRDVSNWNERLEKLRNELSTFKKIQIINNSNSNSNSNNNNTNTNNNSNNHNNKTSSNNSNRKCGNNHN